MVVTGWKDIANYLRCGIRTVQRWEERGMPVHRPLPGKRSHVVAYTEELDWWVTDHQPRHAVPDNVIVSIAKARKLREEARSRRAELRTQMQALRHEIEELRAKRRNGVAPPPAKAARIVSGALTENAQQTHSNTSASRARVPRLFRPYARRSCQSPSVPTGSGS